MKRIDSEMASLILECSRRQVQILVREGQLANHGSPRRLILDAGEVSQLASARRKLTDGPRSPKVC